jgi:hypothetical protein
LLLRLWLLLLCLCLLPSPKHVGQCSSKVPSPCSHGLLLLLLLLLRLLPSSHHVCQCRSKISTPQHNRGPVVKLHNSGCLDLWEKTTTNAPSSSSTGSSTRSGSTAATSSRSGRGTQPCQHLLHGCLQARQLSSLLLLLWRTGSKRLKLPSQQLLQPPALCTTPLLLLLLLAGCTSCLPTLLLLLGCCRPTSSSSSTSPCLDLKVQLQNPNLHIRPRQPCPRTSLPSTTQLSPSCSPCTSCLPSLLLLLLLLRSLGTKGIYQGWDPQPHPRAKGWDPPTPQHWPSPNVSDIKVKGAIAGPCMHQ